MILIVCIDDNKGMMFNHRRQSQDRVLRRHILDMVGNGKLWMNEYSGKCSQRIVKSCFMALFRQMRIF